MSAEASAKASDSSMSDTLASSEWPLNDSRASAKARASAANRENFSTKSLSALENQRRRKSRAQRNPQGNRHGAKKIRIAAASAFASGLYPNPCDTYAAISCT